jgi:hypothetical protein
MSIMSNWWDFGESVGYPGKKLATHLIPCPFCGTRGNYSVEHHSEMKHKEGEKTLNFDTLKCGNCAGFILVFWSATSHFSRQGIHSSKHIPWYDRITQAPEHWPPEIQNFWIQAHRSLNDENWDAASMMARSALQALTREQKAVGSNLKQEIDDLGKKGVLPPIIIEFSNEIRLIGNTSAHPKPGQVGVDPDDAKDIVEFLDIITEYIYDLPKQINDYRERRKNEA